MFLKLLMHEMNLINLSCLMIRCILTCLVTIFTCLFLSSVFGTPLELTVQRQQSSVPIPNILMKCADSLILSGDFLKVDELSTC